MSKRGAGEDTRACSTKTELWQCIGRVVHEFRRDFSVLLGQSDPGLDAVHRLTRGALCVRRALRMADSATCCHPVHCARSNDKIIAEIVFVADRPFE